MGEYVIPPDWGGEQERLRLLGELYDPATLARMDALGLGEGWRGLEIGVGGGSTARAMAARTGPAGRLVATDINPDFLVPLEGVPGIETVVSDVRVDDFPPGSFDLIHTRFLLNHLPDPLEVMKRVAGWLAPGGWLLVEEADTATAVTASHPLWVKIMDAFMSVDAVEVNLGRALASQAAAVGLCDIRLSIDTDVVRGGTDLARWYATTIFAVRKAVTARGVVTEEDVDDMIAQLEDPAFLEPGFAVFAAAGRKDPAGSPS